MSDPRCVVNGMSALTGEYLIPPMTLAEAAARARGKPPPSEQAGWLRKLVQKLSGRFFGLPLDVEPTELSAAGWAVVFTPGTPAEVRQALKPLIEQRARQAPP